MLARELSPSGMPSCSSRIRWYGPATIVTKYVDNGWPVQEDGEHVHAVSEFAANLSGALSPFGDVTFPLPVEDLPFVQSKTVVNR